MRIAFISVIVLTLSLFVFSTARAQEGTSTLYSRLCKTWRMYKLEDNGAEQKSDEAQKEYRLVFKNDSTTMQGLAPDGLIPGTWNLDTKTMNITVKDTKTNTSYKMKIIKISSDELILQTSDNDKALVIYYKAVPE